MPNPKIPASPDNDNVNYHDYLNPKKSELSSSLQNPIIPVSPDNDNDNDNVHNHNYLNPK